MKKYMIALLAVLVACAGEKKNEEKAEQQMATPKPAVENVVEYARTEAGNPIVQFGTAMGDIEIEVFENECPIHAQNFLRLIENGFYDDVLFHRVIANFMIQSGDPTGTGGGGPGYTLEPEPLKYKNLRTYVAMAQSTRGINGSQFYILVKDSPHLDNQFTCFARVISGMDVVDAIAKVKTTGNDRPVEPVKIIQARPKAPPATEGS